VNGLVGDRGGVLFKAVAQGLTLDFPAFELCIGTLPYFNADFSSSASRWACAVFSNCLASAFAWSTTLLAWV